jgi:hypothetical protein
MKHSNGQFKGQLVSYEFGADGDLAIKSQDYLPKEKTKFLFSLRAETSSSR